MIVLSIFCFNIRLNIYIYIFNNNNNNSNKHIYAKYEIPFNPLVSLQL